MRAINNKATQNTVRQAGIIENKQSECYNSLGNNCLNYNEARTTCATPQKPTKLIMPSDYMFQHCR